MKKILAIVGAALLVCGVAGTAAASFEKGDAIVSIYKEGGAEIGIDLDLPGSGKSVMFDLSLFGSGTTVDQLNAGAWANTLNFQVPEGSMFFATTSDAAPGYNPSSIQSFNGSADNVYPYYANRDLNDDDVTVGLTTDPGSYDYKFNAKSNGPGTYGFINASWQIGEADLGDLLTDDVVTLYLHEYELAGMVFEYRGYDAITFELVDADTVKVTNTPIPGAVYLLGTGLVALFGIRRRNA